MRHDPVAEAPPFHATVGAPDARWIVTVDHATNRVPPEIGGGDLGIAAEDMARHIAFDPGALGVARRMATRLSAPLVWSDFSRLVIDPNRGETDPTLIMRLYDGTVIPANRRVDPAERRRRLDAYYRPYHAEVGRVAAAHPGRALAAIHSFTPQLRGRPPRPWHVGVLYPLAAPALGLAAIEALRRDSDLIVGDNQPYPGDLPGDSIDRHALQADRDGLLIEVRNDLIDTPDREIAWGDRLAIALDAALDAVRAAA